MHSSSAKIKDVRPFNWISTKEPDQEFALWKKAFSHLVLEVGCGAGLHPIQWASSNPKQGMIAIERTKTKSQAFQQRMRNHELENIFVVCGDAMDWVPANIKKPILDEIFFLYPNPYPKEKQANKRWYRSPFMHYLLGILKNGGKIHFATNEAFLFEEGLLYANKYWQFDVLNKRSSENDSWKPRTHFEKKYLERGATCFDVTFRKTLAVETSM